MVTRQMKQIACPVQNDKTLLKELILIRNERTNFTKHAELTTRTNYISPLKYFGENELFFFLSKSALL